MTAEPFDWPEAHPGLLEQFGRIAHGQPVDEVISALVSLVGFCWSEMECCDRPGLSAKFQEALDQAEAFLADERKDGHHDARSDSRPRARRSGSRGGHRVRARTVRRA